jgi:hypothetical protein
MMSKQLALSIATSVLAMSAFALFAPAARHAGSGSDGALWSPSISAPDLPAIGRLLPTLQ